MGIFNIFFRTSKEPSRNIDVRLTEEIIRQANKILRDVESIRAEKNKLPYGKTLANRLEILAQKDMKAYIIFYTELLPRIKKVVVNLLALKGIIKRSRDKIYIPDSLFENLENARIELESDIRSAISMSNKTKPSRDRAVA